MLLQNEVPRNLHYLAYNSMNHCGLIVLNSVGYCKCLKIIILSY